MTHLRSCQWCGKFMQVDGNRDSKTVYFCSKPCVDAEKLFQLHYSDEEINRRWHYAQLTHGGDDEEVKKLPP